MSTEKGQAEKSVITNQAVDNFKNSNLVEFDESNTVSTGKDINTKITALDGDLASLRAELGSINSSVEEGLDRLGDTDTDLTAKVSETYKRLGEIDNSYKLLIEISERIDNDISKLNGDVNVVAEQSAEGIKNLEKSTVSQTNEFAQKNQQVVSKVNHLVETSKLTSQMMNQDIQSTTQKMLQIEKSVVAQIDSLSNVTKDKSQLLENNIENNSARILKLQSVDEAIIRRATTLEITAAELTVKGQYIDTSVEQLQDSSDNLSNNIIKLKERVTSLEDVTMNQGLKINTLQAAGEKISNVVSMLSDRENKRFNMVTAGFLLMLVVVAVAYFSQQSQFSLNDEKLVGVQQVQTITAADTQASLLMLENDVQKIKKEVISMQDHVQSVDGRLNQSSPLSTIGNDNIIHGAEWISSLPEKGYVIQLAYIANKDAMFEIADRYSFRLKDSLSYFEANDDVVNKYVLLSGNYATAQDAILAVESLPTYIDMQKPVIRKLKSIQHYIADK